jgi:hypothetical protein
MQLRSDASAISCTRDKFGTKAGTVNQILTAKPILSPCVKHEIEGLVLLED